MKPNYSKSSVKNVKIEKRWEELDDKSIHLVSIPVSNYIRKLEKKLDKLQKKWEIQK